jgi:hypothetical protein
MVNPGRENDLRQLALLSEAADDMRARQSELTVADQRRFLEMEETLREITQRYVPDLEPVRAVLGGRLLTARDYREFMPNLKIEIKPEGMLPSNILEVLNRQCPVYGGGSLVKDTHILAWVPDNLSLSALSKAVDGRVPRLIFSDDFIKNDKKLAGLTLTACRRSCHWALIPETLQVDTKKLNFNDSVAALKNEYVQADVISFSAVLLLYALKYPHTRLYPDTYGWCEDPRIGTYLEHIDGEACYGGGASRALYVGNLGFNGLRFERTHSGDFVGNRGCAAAWNFGTWYSDH